MTPVVFSWMITLVLLIAELAAGNAGIWLPLSAGSVLYFTTTSSWKNALCLALVSGLLLDGIFGRSYPVASMLLPFAAAGRRAWFPAVIRSSGVLSALSTGIVASLFFGFALIFYTGNAGEAWTTLWHIPVWTVLGALGFPAFAFFLDGIAGKIGAPRYFCDMNEDAPRHRVRCVSGKTMRSDPSK